MRWIAKCVVGLLLLAGLAACAGASSDELMGYALRIGLPTTGSLAVEDNTALKLDLNEKCEGQLFSDLAPGTYTNAQYQLDVRVKGQPPSAPSVTVLVGDKQLGEFVSKLKDASHELKEEDIMMAEKLTEECW